MNETYNMQWAKDRAIEYVNRGELVNALASFTSDLGKTGQATPTTDMLLAMEGTRAVMNNDARAMRDLIDGFS